MRTTLDLPDDLLREAKIAAVQRGSTLRDLITTALRRELSVPGGGGRKASKWPAIQLPPDAPILQMSPAAMKAVLAQEDEADDLVRTG